MYTLAMAWSLHTENLILVQDQFLSSLGNPLVYQALQSENIAVITYLITTTLIFWLFLEQLDECDSFYRGIDWHSKHCEARSMLFFLVDELVLLLS